MSLGSEIHLRQTEAFVAERPAEIIINRRPRLDTGSGGWKYGPAVALAPQTMRKVGSSLRSNAESRTTEDGRVVTISANMIGLPSVDIAIGDKFTLDGVEHEVVGISRLPEWRVQAEVTELGS